MTKHLFAITVVALAIIITSPGMAKAADKDAAGGSISDFTVQPLFRAVRLNWKVNAPFKGEATFQLLRSDSFAEGPYEEVATIPYNKRVKEYTYVDKSMPAESTYFYKLAVTGIGEAYGPVSARPSFSVPAT